MSQRTPKRPHPQKPAPHRPHGALSRERSERVPRTETAPARRQPRNDPDALLRTMAHELGWAEPEKAGVALRAVLEALRDHLAHRTTRLTQDLVGLIAGTRTHPRDPSASTEADDQAQFLARVAAALPSPASAADTPRVVAAAIGVLERHCPNCHCSDFGLGNTCRCVDQTAAKA